VLVSALLSRDSVSYYVLLQLDHEYYTPRYVFEELLEHVDLIFEKSRLSGVDILRRLLELLVKVKIIEEKDVRENLKKGYKIIGQRDIDDTPFVAAMLAINADGILSYDKDFELIGKHGYEWLTPTMLLKRST